MSEILENGRELMVMDAQERKVVAGGMIKQYEKGRPSTPPNKPPCHFWYGGTIADAGL
ncbi:MAG: hypothetical protein M3Q00_11515 [Pseudomonadota bacterium]|nr:hypothetical protein [Pseudomonadota bacterium]